ncbi:MAG: enoyl-CoA hydratase/isomerase family protein [Gammaproteobacteria bacterium]|nr:enoyl-CoA hydratase/isomerase family protein [Gammaproteobacteria bacterium]
MNDKTDYEFLIVKNDGPLAIFTLNRADKLNAINSPMIDELNQALDVAEADEKIRVIILKGAGKCFSAGFDLNTDKTTDEDEKVFWRKELRKDFDIIMRFWDSPKTTIAAVHGYCLGSGMEMAVACDITLAAHGSRFGAPEVRFGSGIVALILPWVIGVKAAKELLLSGDDKVSTERALSLGLVNRVMAEEDLEKETLQLAKEIANNDSEAVRLTKQAINKSCETMGMREAMLEALDIDVEIETTETPESKEFNRILHEQGTRAALAWRENKTS